MYLLRELFIIEIGLCYYGSWEVLSLLSVSWRNRKAGGIIRSKYKCLRIRSASVWEDEHSSSNREKVEFTLPPSFGSIWALREWMMPTHWGRSSALFTSPIQMFISSRNTVIDTSRNNVFQESGHHLAITMDINKLL